MSEPTLFDDPNRIVLSDGSLCVLEPRSKTSTLISREIDGVCVWGQGFSRTVDHAGQVAAVVDGMKADPLAYTRFGHDPVTGKAYDGPHAPVCRCGECP